MGSTGTLVNLGLNAPGARSASVGTMALMLALTLIGCAGTPTQSVSLD
jgi:hypothetical protein